MRKERAHHFLLTCSIQREKKIFLLGEGKI